MIHTIVALPWPQLGGAATFLSFCFIVLAPRVSLFRRAMVRFVSDVFTHEVVQEVKDLRVETKQSIEGLRVDTRKAIDDHLIQHRSEQQSLERERIRWHSELRALSKRIGKNGATSNDEGN